MFESHAASRGSLRLAILAGALLLAAPTYAQKAQSGPQTGVVKLRPSTAAALTQAEHDALRKSLLVTNAFGTEVEPNNTPATANPLGPTPVRIRADNFLVPLPGIGDEDVFSFTAGAGDRVYAATMSAFTAASTDTLIDIIASDQTTVIEFDDEDGSIGNAANIAGVVLPTAGTYYVRVRPFTFTMAGTIRPYELYVRVLSGSPTAETEPNDNPTPQALAGNGWMSGAITPLAENDTYIIAANAGDTIVTILDVDPERDSPEWNGVLGIGVFNNFFLTVNGSTVGGALDDINPSEAHYMTVDSTGAFQAFVNEATATPAPSGAPTNTYHLSVSVIPGDTLRSTTNTCTGTTGPITTPGTTDFTCTLGAGPIDNLQLRMSETHAGATPATADLDVSLISPDGNEVVLFDDPASPAGAGAPQLNFLMDDEAGLPMSITQVYAGNRFQPEGGASHLDYFKGMEAGGVWTLRIRDDAAANAGTLNSWSLTVGARPTAGCTAPVTILNVGFDTTDDGFTHSGTADEWERGVPTLAPITTCHSGSCWDTDLDNTYDANANYDLVSPNIDLTLVPAPIALTWWQKYQIDTATNDPFWVEVRIVGNPASARKVWEWKGPLMTRSVGTPATVINQSAGWGVVEADISSFAGQIVEVRYHVQTSATVQLAGWAIDDVLVRSACLVPVELLDYSVE